MTIIKQTSMLLATLFAALSLCLPTKAQTLKQYDYLHPSVQEFQAEPLPAPPNLSNTFFGSVITYFGTFNPALPFGTPMFSLWAGADTVDNQTMAASMAVEVSPFASSTNSFVSGLSIESVTRNTTVAGTVLSEQAGVGWSVTHIDTRLTGYLDVGDRFDTKQVYFAPGFRVKKMLTQNTFAGTGIEIPFYLSHGAGVSSGAPSPTLYLLTGFNF